MSSTAVAEALRLLRQDHPLTILSLAEPILSPGGFNASKSVNASGDDNQGSTTPASLQADLSHYKELFSKLRFSYVEQVTKERFLRAILADPPELVDASQNAELEEQLRTAKAALKAKKETTEKRVEELEDTGRRLAQSYEIIQLQTTQLEALPLEIENLEATISTLKAAQEPASSNPVLNLPLAATSELLAKREAELAELDRQLADLQSAVPRKKREVAKLENELGPLEARKRAAIEEAKDAQRKRGKGGLGEELEERGKWLKNVDAGLRLMLEI
ncbi:hypothetical protein MBLNU459_g6664t1 [Dothideomycetes sp. NU459]